MRSQKFAIITTIGALLLVISAVSMITPYIVFAQSNAQTYGANNDCPADVFSFFVVVQQQASANCLNDLNSVQDSDGAAISSTPFNAAPSQALDLELEFGGTIPPTTDNDMDGVPDESDNCPTVPNPDQQFPVDTDGDGVGDGCETPSTTDTDDDGTPDETDNCPTIPNTDQTDTDGDGVGNACDNCPDTSNPDQTDANENGIGDACETELTPTCEDCLAPLIGLEGRPAPILAQDLGLGPSAGSTDEQIIEYVRPSHQVLNHYLLRNLNTKVDIFMVAPSYHYKIYKSSCFQIDIKSHMEHWLG